MKKVALDRLRLRQNVFLVVLKITLLNGVSVVTNFVTRKRDKQKKHHTFSSRAGARRTMVREEVRAIFAPPNFFGSDY